MNLSRLLRFALTLMLLNLSNHAVHAQFEHWLHKTHAERYQSIRTYLNHLNETRNDTAAIYQSLRTLKTVALRAGDHELALEADYMHATLTSETAGMQKHKVIGEINALIGKANREGNLQMRIRSRMLLRHYYWYFTKNYEKAF